MGNYIRPLSDVVFSIASDNLWIEDSAIQQLYTTAKLTGMKRVIGMPDLHPGRGYPIGAAFFSRGRFYPALVGNDIGNDIGCGMALWQTDILERKYNADKLEKRLARLLEQQRQNECAALKSERRLFHHQIERGNPLRIFKGMAFTPQ